MNLSIVPSIGRGQACHGRISCRVCWKDGEGNHKLMDGQSAQLVNDPGYWGAPDPSVLVLGMSKGFTQSNMMATDQGSFDRIAYAKFRKRLLQGLQAVGLMEGVQNIDPKLTAAEKEFGFASVIRCSMTANDGGEFVSASGKLISALKRPQAAAVMDTCLKTYIGALSPKTRLVVLLGNSSGYVDYMRKAMPKLFSDYAAADGYDGLLYKAGGRFFVHVAHPSGSNGHFEGFLTGNANDGNGQGIKRELAKKAISKVLSI
jgi:hypothetical protein